MLQLIPVLDVQGGQVVRGIAGRRSEYRPIVSRLAPSAEPLAVAAAFRSHFGLSRFYLADLDAIAGDPPAVALFAALQEQGFALWVDAGVRTARGAAPLAAAGVDTVIAGLETMAGPEVLAELCATLGPERVLFSLDLKAGQPLGAAAAWQEREPAAIAARAVGLGVRRVLVLDLASVGVGGGTGTEALCQQLTAEHPLVAFVAGGGVRDVADLRRLQAAGVRGVLLASALHDGRITPEQVAELVRE
jgi:phosphoribosylformimino-5-aminoimidazole carboxamide ribotide isomerase